MPRPRKWRRLRHEPQPAIFKPVGLPLGKLEQVTLLHEELEALRLTDLEGQHQADAASQMNISRSTLQRLVTEARRKVALALVNGAALHIEGGVFRVAAVRWHCGDCGHDWDITHGSGQGQPERCPQCGSSVIRER
ncbi:MAG: DUF134 domain-containing protein [Anaerolineales bacterium]|nr:DUF134 domain-containing protein [Anaerolineales bacterium]